MSAIRNVLHFQERYNNTEPEDEWFGSRLWIMKNEKVASGNMGVLAVEDVYIEKPMGYHIRDGGSRLNDDVWKDHAQRKKILQYCPELSLIMDMKLERERCEGDRKDGTIGLTPEQQEKKKQEELKKQEEAKKKEEEARKKLEEEKQKLEEEKKQQEAASTDSAAATQTSGAAKSDETTKV